MKLILPLLLILARMAMPQDTTKSARAPAVPDTAYNYASLYENGFYEDAVRLLDSLRASAPDSLGDDPLTVLAFCDIILNRHNEAIGAFKQILARNPMFSLDPILTPPRFFEVFHQARTEWEASPEGSAILSRKKNQEDSLRSEELKKIINLERRPAYIRIPVSLLPGGAGQFYYHKLLKGSLFFAIEAAALGACIWSYNRRLDFKDPQYGWTPANQGANDRYVRYMRIELSVFTLAYLAGVVDGFLISPDKERHK